MPSHFEDLLVYQKALNFVDEIYTLTKGFPRDETFLLVDQLRRAAVSITLNIAEGSGRTKREFNHFLNTSRTSCYECVAALEIARRQQYIKQDVRDMSVSNVEEIMRMLNGLKNSLQ